MTHREVCGWIASLCFIGAAFLVFVYFQWR